MRAIRPVVKCCVCENTRKRGWVSVREQVICVISRIGLRFVIFFKSTNMMLFLVITSKWWCQGWVRKLGEMVLALWRLGRS